MQEIVINLLMIFNSSMIYFIFNYGGDIKIISIKFWVIVDTACDQVVPFLTYLQAEIYSFSGNIGDWYV